jgi:CubicO group peptidase (beta-lactamase class C family)
VLGVLVERASGYPLGEFMSERLFGPLGMVDTAFSVPPEKLDRLTTAYAPDPVTGAPGVLDGVEDSWWARPPAMANGAAWLVSAIDDFWAFVRMLEGGGRADGVRILSEDSVHQMTTDHLNAEQRAANHLFLGEGGGWGYGMRAPASGGADSGVPGGFGWEGGTGTSWRTDPATGLTGILFTQRAMTSPEPPPVVVDFWIGAYGALSD